MFWIPVTVSLHDYQASVASTNLVVPMSTSSATRVGTVRISSNNISSAAAQAGDTTLTFKVTKETYYKNGSQVTDYGAPITVVQDASNRSLADIYVNQSYNWLEYDNITATVQGTDGSGIQTNQFTA